MNARAYEEIRLGILVIVLSVRLTGATALPSTWVQPYHGVSGRAASAKALAVDSHGTVFVTGTDPNPDCGFDCVTVAYSSAGTPLWTNRLDRGIDDEVAGIAVGPEGNVYVAGSFDSETTGHDYSLVAYSGNGVSLWTNRFDGENHGYDAATALAIDPRRGNIYVTGFADLPGGNSEYATVAFASSGVCLWTNYYRGPAPGNSMPQAIAVDSNSGNVHVTGSSPSLSNREDYLTVAYSSDGLALWTNRFDGTAHDQDFAFALATAENGQVYVAGSATSLATGSDFATIAYDSHGAPLWTNRYGGTVNYLDEAHTIAVAPNGNIYVSGLSEGVSGECVTIAYSRDGLPLWTNRFDSPLHPTTASVDGCGNLYLAGSNLGEYLVLACSPSGTLLWTAQYAGPELAFNELHAMALDLNGNVYVTGFSALGGNSANEEWATIKYTQAPVLTMTFPPDSALGIVLQGKCGGNYQIEISTNLMHWTTWTNLPNTGGSGTVELPNLISTNSSPAFYRALWTP